MAAARACTQAATLRAHRSVPSWSPISPLYLPSITPLSPLSRYISPQIGALSEHMAPPPPCDSPRTMRRAHEEASARGLSPAPAPYADDARRGQLLAEWCARQGSGGSGGSSAAGGSGVGGVAGGRRATVCRRSIPEQPVIPEVSEPAEAEAGAGADAAAEATVTADAVAKAGAVTEVVTDTAAESQAVGAASVAAVASADSSAAAAAGGPSVVPRLALGAAALGRGRASTSEDAAPATLDRTSGPTFSAPPRPASSFEISPLEEVVRRASTPRGMLRSPRSSTRSSQPAPASAAYRSPRAAYKSPRPPQPMSQFECLSVKERMKRFQG